MTNSTSYEGPAHYPTPSKIPNVYNDFYFIHEWLHSRFAQLQRLDAYEPEILLTDEQHQKLLKMFGL